jgi:glycosyltransferase involved in cell wall biosynthesis
VRAVIVSSTLVDAVQRGRLHGLVGLGCSVVAAIPERRRRTGAASAWGEERGVRLAPIPLKGDDPGTARWQEASLMRLLTEIQPEIVQIEEAPWTPVAALVSRLAARLGSPTVLLGHASIEPTLSWGHRMQRGRTLSRLAGVAGINRAALALLAADRPEVPQAVLPLGGVPAPAALERQPHEAFAIGFFGRLVPERGLDLLLKACVQLTTRWSLTVVGTGPAQDELELLAARLGIASRISWLGGLPPGADAAVWPALDCVALPSRSSRQWVEPTGRIALEAMGHGLAVVGSGCGALPEVIAEAGRVVPEDDPEALAGALQQLADDGDAREQLGTLARRRVLANFSDDAIARQTLSFWTAARGTNP